MDKRNKKDILLIQNLKNGNEKTYSFLVDTYYEQLCVYANSLVNDGISSEDIVQNVFIKVWKNRAKLKEGYSIKSYLYKSVYNEFIDQYRKKKAITALEKKYIDALDTIIIENPETDFEKLKDLVRIAIKELPPKCRQIFELSKKEGLTNPEIAAYLNISTKTIEAQITKAFKLIRAHTQGQYSIKK